MPIITDPHAVRALYAEAAEKGFLIPGLGAENRDTLECCFRAAKRLGEVKSGKGQSSSSSTEVRLAIG